MVLETDIFENTDEKLNIVLDSHNLDILEFKDLNNEVKLEGRVNLLEQKIKILEENIERKIKICSMHHNQLRKSLDLRQTEGEVQENDSQIIWSTINNLVSNTKEEIDKLRVEFYNMFNSYKDEIKKFLPLSTALLPEFEIKFDEVSEENNFEIKIKTLILDTKNAFSNLLIEVIIHKYA